MNKPTNLKEAGLEEMENWEIGSGEVKSDPLVDTQTGQAVVIRNFEFKINPEAKDLPSIDKQTLFNIHARQITHSLWGDGLVPFDSVPPRVIIDEKKGVYYIFVPCIAKSGVTIVEKPQNLSEALKAPSTGN